MKLPSHPTFILLCLLATVFTTLRAQVGEMQFPEGSVQHVVLATEMKWIPCPPNLPSGCEMAILEGSPKNNELFTVRFRMNTTIVMPAHTHPKDERVTILEGKAAVAFGKDARREDAREFVPGDYYVNAREAVHTVWIEEGTVLQITGIGPWEAHFVKE